MPKRTNLTLLSVLLLCSSGVAASARVSPHAARVWPRPSFRFVSVAAGDREQDGLTGPVRRVKTETARITVKGGRPVEGPRAVLETATYDNKGAKVDNAYFLAAGGTLTGKEVYKYDDKGNMVEMTLQNDDGSLQSKETYAYEFDSFGNWTKMTTSVAVIEGGKVSFEPTEVTYRTISYYMDEASVAKLSQPAATAPPPANAADKPVAVTSAPATPATATAAKNRVAAPPPVINAPRVALAPPTASLAGVAGAEGGPFVKPDGDAPARPLARGPVKPLSGGILNGRALSMPAPVYPEMAKRARANGLVAVEVVIDVNGRVISAKAVSGPVMLHATAEKAAMQARFSPTLLSGQPVRVSGVINYNFNLN